MRALLLLLCASLAWAQDAKPVVKRPGGAVQPLPKGKTKVFEAIVMEVEGTAQARPRPKAKWAKLAVNQRLKPGTVIRTGRRSHVALRVGPNATMLIERQSRIMIPEIVQDGDVMRTRVKMSFGKTDVRVDRIGLTNDFEVTTPTATLAVRGTVVRITWDAVRGFRARGVPGNKLRAIEIGYRGAVAKLFLSRGDVSTDKYKIHSFFKTYFLPLKGAIGESELYDKIQSAPDFLQNPSRQRILAALRKKRGIKQLPPTGGLPEAPQEGR